MEMDQETARVLLTEGGTLILLGVPAGTEFGVDTAVWNTEEDFRGVKMIPPGLHYVHYAATGIGSGDGGMAPRSGFMHYFKKRDFVVKMWDKKLEDFSRDEITEESLQRLRDNLINLDRYLAPYPYETAWGMWKALTGHISESLMERLVPACGVIRSALELMSCKDEDRPRGRKSSEIIKPEETDKEPTSEPSGSQPSTDIDEKSLRKKTKTRFSMEEKEEALLPNLKPAPGTEIRFSKIPHDKYPEGSSPQEITKHHLDQSYSLELVIAQHDEPLQVIGELQFAFVSFLIGHSLDAFEHWKNLVVLLCSCEDALHKYTVMFCQFVRTLEVQIDETPEAFLADIVMNKNLVYKKLREFFKTALVAKVDGRLWTLIERFRDNLTNKLLWDFTGLDSEEEDERPVVVRLE